MYILAVFINVSSKWRSCRNFMLSGHKSEIIILSMYLINKKLCSLILCNEIENSFFIINAMQDLLQRSRNTLYFYSNTDSRILISTIIDKYLFKYIMSITNIACLLLQIYHITSISVTARLVLEIKYLCLYLSCFTYTFQHIFHTAY